MEYIFIGRPRNWTEEIMRGFQESAEGIKQIEKYKALSGCKQLQDSIAREILSTQKKIYVSPIDFHNHTAEMLKQVQKRNQ